MDLTSLADKLGKKVQPKDEFYQFSPDELADEIMEAIVYIDPELTPETLSKNQEILVMYKARSSCYYGLASKHAENMRFRIENDEYHGQQPYDNYMRLAQKYESLFEASNTIQVSTVTRTQTGTGRKAGFYPGDMP